MSDTHSMTSKLKIPIPEGDVFIHAGDFTNKGTLEEVKAFNSWIGKVRESIIICHMFNLKVTISISVASQI